MARSAELAVLACRGHFAEQVFKSVAHDVLSGGTVARASEKLVDQVDGVRQHLAFVGVELEISVGHAVVEAA